MQEPKLLRRAWRSGLMIVLSSPSGCLLVLWVFLMIEDVISALLVSSTILGYVSLLCMLATYSSR